MISNDKEKKLFITHGFKENSLIKAGLPRWDLLNISNKKAKKEILIMFTFRNFKNKEIIENSIYKQNIEHFINNADLIELLKEKNIKLNLSLHHMITENKQFEIINNNINLISPLEVSQCIKSSSLLITDFSSVAFDFMFLKAEFENNNREFNYENYFCSMKNSLSYCKLLKNRGSGYKYPKLSELCEKLEIDNMDIKIASRKLYGESCDFHDARFDTVALFLAVNKGMDKIDKFIFLKNLL